jgi:hypothetical protein
MAAEDRRPAEHRAWGSPDAVDEQQTWAAPSTSKGRPQRAHRHIIDQARVSLCRAVRRQELIDLLGCRF